MPSGTTRRSRRTRGERPEIVPPKSDEEPEVDEDGDYTDPKTGSVIALGAIRGRRSKRAAASGGGEGGGRKSRAKDTAAPKLRTRRTRGAAAQDEDKSKSGDSSQNPSDSESSDADDDGDDTAVSGEDNATAGDDKVGDEGAGKDNDEVSDGDDDPEENSNRKNPKRSGRRTEKTPVATSPPKRPVRSRRGAAKSKADESSVDDNQATASLQSDGDSSSKVEEKPTRRGARKRKLPDRPAPKRGTKTKATREEHDDDRQAGSSDDDGGKQPSGQKNKKDTTSIDEDPPVTRTTKDSKESSNESDADAKSEDSAKEKLDEEKEEDEQKKSEQSSQGSDTEKDPYESSTVESQKAQREGDETSNLRRRLKRSRATSPPKDVSLKKSLSPVEEPNQKGKSEAEEDEPISMSSGNDEKSSNKAPVNPGGWNDEGDGSESKQGHALQVVKDDKRNVTTENGEQDDKNRDNSLNEIAAFGTNGAKRKLTEPDGAELDGAEDRASAEHQRKRTKNDILETKSDSPQNDGSDTAELEGPISTQDEDTKPAQDDQEQPVDIKANEDDVPQVGGAENPVDSSTDLTENEDLQSEMRITDPNGKDKSNLVEPLEKSRQESVETEKEPLVSEPGTSAELDSPDDSRVISSPNVQSKASVEPLDSSIAEEEKTKESPKESDVKPSDSKEGEGSTSLESPEGAGTENSTLASGPGSDDKDMSRYLKEDASDSSLKDGAVTERIAVDTKDGATREVHDAGTQENVGASSSMQETAPISDSKEEVSEKEAEVVTEASAQTLEAKADTDGLIVGVDSDQTGIQIATNGNAAAEDLPKKASCELPTVAKLEVNEKETVVEGPNEMDVDEVVEGRNEMDVDEVDNNDKDLQPLTTKDDAPNKLQTHDKEPETADVSVSVAAGEKQSENEYGADAKEVEIIINVSQTEDEPEVSNKPEAIKYDQKDDVAVSDKGGLDVSGPMEVEDGADHPEKPLGSDGVLADNQGESSFPTVGKSSDTLLAGAVEVDLVSLTDMDVSDSTKAGFMRTVTEEVEPIPQPVKTVVWKPLSSTKRVATSNAPTLYGLNENKLNRVKIVLYTLGSNVHRGRGFERLFADYWDAVCLRLSKRLSSHTSDQCDQAITAFLVSKKLRKTHNQFIMGIMRRSTRTFARPSEVASHIPVKWRERVKVRVIQTTPAPKSRKQKSPMTALEKEFLRIGDMPHPVPGQPYKEPWQVFDEAVDNSEIGLEQSAAVESNSQCIPGALVVDPLLRAAAEEKGLQSSDSAMWLLTVAVREHTRNVLKGSIAHKKALEKGEIHPKFLHYPNILASSAKTSAKNRIDTSVPPKQEGDKKTRISALDVFSASKGLPSGHIGSLGGAISRLSLEQSMQSAFLSVPPFFPGKDFKDVQSYVSTEIFDVARAQEEAAAAKINAKVAGTSPKTDPITVALSSSKQEQSQAEQVSRGLEIKSDPKQHAGDASAVSKNTADDKAVDHKEGTGAAPFGKPGDGEASKVAEQSGLQQQTQRASVGAGRGAKNLRALMARASSDANKDDDSATAATSTVEVPSEATTAAKTEQRKDNNESKNSSELTKPESDETSQVKAEETMPPKKDESADPERPAKTDDSKSENETSQDTEASSAEEVKTVTAKPPAAASPNMEEKKTPVERKDPVNAESSTTNAEPTTDDTAVPPLDPADADTPKAKGLGSKNLSAMRSRSTTENPTDEKKRGNKEEEEENKS